MDITTQQNEVIVTDGDGSRYRFAAATFWVAAITELKRLDLNPLPAGDSLEQEPSLSKQRDHVQWLHRRTAFRELQEHFTRQATNGNSHR